MSQKGPGKSHRHGISLAKLFRMFPDNATAERWFIEQRWPDGIACHYCGSIHVQTGAKHKTMPFRCRDCRKRFSVRTGTVMQASNLSYQVWVIASYLMTTSLKGVSSMKLHRDLDISQKAAWFLAHRLRDSWRVDGHSSLPFLGPVEVDETYFGGKRRNMSNARRKALADTGRGPVGKVAVVGAKDRRTKRVAAKVVHATDQETLQGFVEDHAAPGATVYTDDATAYESLRFNHATVKHSLSEYVKGEIYTNGIESLWSMLKRAHMGTYHKLSPKHLHRYVTEFVARHNQREQDTLDQMGAMVRGMDCKRLRYQDLIAQ